VAEISELGTDVQREGRALGSPTRYRIFRYIAKAHAPVDVRELTDHLQLNHNAIRRHLGVLKESGLILEKAESRSLPGRPRLLYTLGPEVSKNWGRSNEYVWLSKLLTGALRRDLEPREAGRGDGRLRARQITGTTPPADLLEAEIARRGFKPTRLDKGKHIEFTLGRCPFAEVAVEDPATVCDLHLGLVEGLVEGLGGLCVDRLVPRKPHRAGCRLIVSVKAKPE
jgi:predicted ArsR family transcriptional regulator